MTGTSGQILPGRCERFPNSGHWRISCEQRPKIKSHVDEVLFVSAVRTMTKAVAAMAEAGFSRKAVPQTPSNS